MSRSQSHSNEVEVLRQQTAAGPSRGASVKGTGRTAAQQRRALQDRQPAQRRRDVVDLTADDDDEVEITQVKIVKRQRVMKVAPVAAAAALPLVAFPTAAGQPPAAPPSPNGYKCIICLDRMDANMATTTCGHMFCYKCISEWVAKSGNCPQCRSKLTKSKIIRVYPPAD